ncbi:hypothetical protein INR49_004488, partial [Caranx melampygus]
MEDTDINDALLVPDANEDSVDIYEGLDVGCFSSNAVRSPANNSQLKDSMDLYEEIVTEEQQGRETLYTENTGLNIENCRLKKNISALLRTARQEVTRKDAEIQRLNQCKDCHGPEKNRSHKTDKDTGQKHDSSSGKSRTYLNAEGHHRSDRTKSPPPDSSHGATPPDSTKERSRERRPDKLNWPHWALNKAPLAALKRSTAGIIGELTEMAEIRTPRIVKSPPQINTLSTTLIPAKRGKMSEFQRTIKGRKSDDGKKKSAESIKGVRAENVRGGKQKTPTKGDLPPVDKAAENRAEHVESLQAMCVEDMCVVDEAESSELEAEFKDVAEQSSDAHKDSGPERSDERCDDVKDTQEDDKKSLTETASGKLVGDSAVQTTSAPSHPIDTVENLESPVADSVPKVVKALPLVHNRTVFPAASSSPIQKEEACPKQGSPKDMEAVSSTISLDSLPQEVLSLPEAIYVLTQTNEEASDNSSVAAEPSSSTSCIAVSKVSSTTEETSPWKMPLLHDEDSMMRTLNSLKRIPDAISPLRSPIRIAKRSHLHIHGKPGHVKSLQK